MDDFIKSCKKGQDHGPCVEHDLFSPTLKDMWSRKAAKVEQRAADKQKAR